METYQTAKTTTYPNHNITSRLRKLNKKGPRTGPLAEAKGTTPAYADGVPPADSSQMFTFLTSSASLAAPKKEIAGYLAQANRLSRP